jgi:hypothetical protein
VSSASGKQRGGPGGVSRAWGTAYGLAALLAASVGCRGAHDVTAPPATDPPPGPPVALAMLASGGVVLASPAEMGVTLPQRWTSSDSTIVRVGATTGLVTQLTGVRTGTAFVTGVYVQGADTLRLVNVSRIHE